MKLGKYYGFIQYEEFDRENLRWKLTRHLNRYAKRYDGLIEEMCLGLGFCGSIFNRRSWHVDDLIPKKGVLTAKRFAQLVLEAERMQSSLQSSDYKKYGPSLENAFERHFRKRVIHLQELHRAVRGLGIHPLKTPPKCFTRIHSKP